MKRSLVLLLSLTALVSAQEPPKPQNNNNPGIPGLNNDGAVLPKVPAQPARTTNRSTKKVLDPNAIAVPEGKALERPELTGIEAADIYFEHTGKRVIMTSQASQVQAYFVQKGPMTYAEVAKLLEITLLAEGLAIVPDPLDPNIVRMVASGAVPGTGAAPLSYLDDPNMLPLTDQLVTYRMQFDNLKPDEALRIFQQVMGQASPSGSITAVTNASSLVIKENASLIRMLIQLKEDIDIPVKVTEAWVKVTYADVAMVSERLNEIYNDRGNSNSTTRTRRATGTPLPGGNRNNAANRAGGGGATSAEDIPLKILPDARTNRILLVGRPGDIAVAESIVKGYDIPSSDGNDFVYRLRYLRVGDFIPIAVDAISATMEEGASGAGGGGRSLANQGANSRTGSNNRNNNNRNNNNRNAAGGGGGGGGSRTSIQEQEIPTAPEAQLVGNTLIVADNAANSLIVNGPPHHIALVKNLLSQLDNAGQQVIISAVIGSYALGNEMNFGMDLARFISNSGGDVGGGRFTAGDNGNGALSAADLTDLAALLGANGGSGQGVSLYGVFNDEFSVFINALEANTNFRSLDRPVITTRNNRVARISSGRRIAIPASTFNSGVNGGQNTNVEYRDVTLELEVQPLINSDTEVTMEISLVRDAVQDTERAIATGVNVPDIATEELTTSVTTKTGSAIILGGLITEEDSDNKSGIPFLSRIPGLGRIFSSTSKNVDRRELVIILRPQIINNEHDYRAFQDSYEEESSFTNQARNSFPKISHGMLPPKGTLDDPSTLTSKKRSQKKRTKKTRSTESKRKRPVGFGKYR